MATGEITWWQLVALMAVGSGVESSMRGVVNVVVDQHAAEGEDADHEESGYRWRLVSSSHRVHKRGALIRRETPDGQARAIVGAQATWIWLDGADVPTAFPRATTAWGWDDYPLLTRRDLSDWSGNDFTRPNAPVTADRFLGRDVWRVGLAPPPHKPFPLTWMVDAETGLVLSQRNDGFETLVEWGELELDVDLPDELFEWRGASLPPPDYAAERAADAEERRAWLAANGLAEREVTLPARLHLHEWSDDGAFQASIDLVLHGGIVRRPRSAERWDTRQNWPFMHRWTTEEWDWELGLAEHPSVALLAQLEQWLSIR